MVQLSEPRRYILGEVDFLLCFFLIINDEKIGTITLTLSTTHLPKCLYVTVLIFPLQYCLGASYYYFFLYLVFILHLEE